ncbi:hypothetical protein ACS0TY_014920 [Phlomoides rotata]
MLLFSSCSAHGADNSVQAGFRWRSRREVVNWLTSMLSKQHRQGDFANDTEIFTLLLSKGADIEVDSVGGTPLHFAARFGKPSIVKFLLQNNVEPDSVSKYLRSSPLITAIYSKKNTFECVKLLLEANADPNKFANGLSPLAHAMRAKSNSCINSLIAARADCGLRPIEHAALLNNDKAIYILLQARPWILAC